MNTKTDLEKLESLAIICERQAREERETLYTSARWMFDADLIREAALELQQLRHALGEPVPEMKGTYPLVLFFGNEADRDAFIAVAKIALPGLESRNL